MQLGGAYGFKLVINRTGRQSANPDMGVDLTEPSA
jgi:hypothetical protein